MIIDSIIEQPVLLLQEFLDPFIGIFEVHPCELRDFSGEIPTVIDWAWGCPRMDDAFVHTSVEIILSKAWGSVDDPCSFLVGDEIS